MNAIGLRHTTNQQEKLWYAKEVKALPTLFHKTGMFTSLATWISRRLNNKRRKGMALVKLDKFEILWLCEGAIGKSHLRWGIYEKMVNEVFPILSEGEREFIYTYLKRDTAWIWERKTLGDTTPYEYWLQTLARFNPTNQFRVTLKKGRKKEVVDAYFWNGKYYTSWNRYCAPEYIKDILQLSYKKCSNKWCNAKMLCKRFVMKPTLDDKLIGNMDCWACDKCDFIIKENDKVEKKEES